MAITASELRQPIYRLLDEVLATGLPLEVERNGRACASYRPKLLPNSAAWPRTKTTS